METKTFKLVRKTAYFTSWKRREQLRTLRKWKTLVLTRQNLCFSLLNMQICEIAVAVLVVVGWLPQYLNESITQWSSEQLKRSGSVMSHACANWGGGRGWRMLSLSFAISLKPFSVLLQLRNQRRIECRQKTSHFTQCLCSNTKRVAWIF